MVKTAVVTKNELWDTTCDKERGESQVCHFVKVSSVSNGRIVLHVFQLVQRAEVAIARKRQNRVQPQNKEEEKDEGNSEEEHHGDECKGIPGNAGTRVGAHQREKEKKSNPTSLPSRELERDAHGQKQAKKHRVKPAGTGPGKPPHSKTGQAEARTPEKQHVSHLKSAGFLGRRPLYIARYLGRRPRAVPLNPPPLESPKKVTRPPNRWSEAFY